jgi:phage tail-like protein
MTDESPISIWPLPKFCFSVSINGTAYPFQEVTGLETETDDVEYRHSNSKLYPTIKMPGISKYGNVTAKKGILHNDEQFASLCKYDFTTPIKPLSVIISLLDENGNPAMSWTLRNPWPARITGEDLKSDGNEVAVESIEFAHEGITLQNYI